MNYESSFPTPSMRTRFYLRRKLKSGIVSTMEVVYENAANFNISAYPGWYVVKSERV